MQLCKDGCLEGLTQLQAHLAGLSVSMRPPLALARAEGGRTVLTVHQGPVREGSGPGAPDLGQEGRMSQARPSQLTPAPPLTPTSTSTAALPPNTARGRGALARPSTTITSAHRSSLPTDLFPSLPHPCPTHSPFVAKVYVQISGLIVSPLHTFPTYLPKVSHYVSDKILNFFPEFLPLRTPSNSNYWRPFCSTNVPRLFLPLRL